MDRYKIAIKFNDGGILDIELETDEDLKKNVAEAHNNKDRIMVIGNHTISKRDIRWIRIEGEKFAKPSGERLPNIREEEQ